MRRMQVFFQGGVPPFGNESLVDSNALIISINLKRFGGISDLNSLAHVLVRDRIMMFVLREFYMTIRVNLSIPEVF